MNLFAYYTISDETWVSKSFTIRFAFRDLFESGILAPSLSFNATSANINRTEENFLRSAHLNTENFLSNFTPKPFSKPSKYVLFNLVKFL